jgi:hypothetical protein
MTPAERRAARKARRGWARQNAFNTQVLQGVISGKRKVVNGRIVTDPRPVAKPPVAPAGMYDPALEAQRHASQRGLLDFSQDTELAGSRAAQDYTFGVEGLKTQRQRAFEDIARQVSMLTRDYGSLARRQAEGDAQAGVINPAIAAKQMQIRAANMAFDRQPLEAATRRTAQDYSTGVGRLGVDFARGGVDRATGLARARRENTQFGLDIGAQERYQATQAGWEPPNTTAPKMFLWPDGKWRKQPWRAPSSFRPGAAAGSGPRADIANPFPR